MLCERLYLDFSDYLTGIVLFDHFLFLEDFHCTYKTSFFMKYQEYFSEVTLSELFQEIKVRFFQWWGWGLCLKSLIAFILFFMEEDSFPLDIGLLVHNFWLQFRCGFTVEYRTTIFLCVFFSKRICFIILFPWVYLFIPGLIVIEFIKVTEPSFLFASLCKLNGWVFQFDFLIVDIFHDSHRAHITGLIICCLFLSDC